MKVRIIGVHREEEAIYHREWAEATAAATNNKRTIKWAIDSASRKEDPVADVDAVAVDKTGSVVEVEDSGKNLTNFLLVYIANLQIF